ncbi:PLP-dependent aminotransferase family protein [Brevibacillus centrosporus]|uniref:MocR-like pyridoxine biosynthesis transcription factor PdxR n=1 Tax=Brevibacillus centrosporus TaxID=54910 RepID=UPI002E1F03AF|nr:PLP-dependent aminotransferase family protein [Brevibacillus centrosporus]
MHIDLDRHSGITLSEQIRTSIADRIQSGLLQEGEKLPSVRKLSTLLDVSLMTVFHAYELLEQEGLIDRIQGKGTFTLGKSKGSKHRPSQNDSEKPSLDWQNAVVDYLPRAQYWRMMQTPLLDVAKLSMAALHSSLIPTEWISKQFFQYAQLDSTLLTEYGPVQGDSKLRGAVLPYFREKSIAVSPNEIMILNGSQQGIDLVASTFVGPGDCVVLEEPAYPCTIDVLRKRGATVYTIPIDEEGMQVDRLAALCDTRPPKLIYTNPTYQNPTGTVMSARRRVQLLELAQSYNAIILEDDATSDLYFGTKPPPPPIKSMDRHGHVIYLKGISKFISPGCRIGFLIADGTFITRLVSSKGISDLGSPLITQKAILPFFTSNQLQKHLPVLREKLKERRDLVLQILNRMAPKSVQWTKPEGGLNIWLSLPPTMNADDLHTFALKEGISFLPGHVCFPTQQQYHHLRLSFSYLDMHSLERSLITLCRLLQDFTSSDRHSQRMMPM